MRAHSFSSRRSTRSRAVIVPISSEQSRIIRGFSAQAVQIGPAVSQSVDLRLQRLLLHGQLLHTVDAVFVKIKELLLVAVKLNGLCP